VNRAPDDGQRKCTGEAGTGIRRSGRKQHVPKPSHRPELLTAWLVRRRGVSLLELLYGIPGRVSRDSPSRAGGTSKIELLPGFLLRKLYCPSWSILRMPRRGLGDGRCCVDRLPAFAAKDVISSGSYISGENRQVYARQSGIVRKLCTRVRQIYAGVNCRMYLICNFPCMSKRNRCHHTR
jgi:hypothetical protein